jgi:hypothetical protein
MGPKDFNEEQMWQDYYDSRIETDENNELYDYETDQQELFDDDLFLDDIPEEY